jgi:hypothetical protein
MLVLPVGPYAPVGPVTPVKPVERRKTEKADRAHETGAASHPARSAAHMTSPKTRAALDDIKLGG